MKRIFAIVAALCLALTASADEGMWLLPLLQKMNGKALKEAGCKLTPDEIYSINHSSLKDAVIHFGGGCTGEIISSDGLIVTNNTLNFECKINVFGREKTIRLYSNPPYLEWKMTHQ